MQKSARKAFSVAGSWKNHPTCHAGQRFCVAGAAESKSKLDVVAEKVLCEEAFPATIGVFAPK